MSTDYALGTLSNVSINGTAMAVNNCSLGKREVLLQRNGIRGTRARFNTDIRKGPQRCAGTITLEPSKSELLALAILALGSGGNTADALTEFDVVVDRGTELYTYADCKIGRFVVSGTQGGIISCSLDLVGKTETEEGSVSAPVSDVPFIMADAVLTLAAAAREMAQFTLVVDNMIDAERFLNSLTLPDVIPQDRQTNLSVSIPYSTANASLYDQAVAGAAGSLALNNGTEDITFSFANLQLPAESPEIPGKTESMLTLNMISTATNNTDTGEITATSSS